MRVRMHTQIGGFRNGEPWPGPGGVIDVPDHEAIDLINAGHAEEAFPDDTQLDQADDRSDPSAAHGDAAATDDDGSTPAGPDNESSAEVTTTPRKRSARRAPVKK